LESKLKIKEKSVYIEPITTQFQYEKDPYLFYSENIEMLSTRELAKIKNLSVITRNDAVYLRALFVLFICSMVA